METPSLSARCVTICLPAGVMLTAGAAGTLLALARRRAGGAPWTGIVEVLRFRRGTLLIARRADAAVRIAPYALPYLHKYFTD